MPVLHGGYTRPTIIAASSLLLSSFDALAHHPGGLSNVGSAGPINTITAATLPQGVTAVALTYEFTALSGLSDAGLLEAARRDEHTHSIRAISSPAATIAYGVTSDLTMSLRVPYVARSDIREGEDGHHDETDVAAEVVRRGDSDGLGDISALGQWRISNSEVSGTAAAVLFGVKAPAGRTGQIDDNGELFETEFQSGSGSWDGMFGLAMTQRLGAWSLDSNLLYTAVGKGTQSIDLGDRFHYNAAVSYRLAGRSPDAPRRHSATSESAGHHHDHGSQGHSHSDLEPATATGPVVDLVLEINGEWYGKQDIAGENDPNSGGNVVYLAPGLRLSTDRWSGFLSVGVPVINEPNGLQSEPDVRVTSGIGLVF